ncbi:MAG: disulfide bond formation protein DsbA [Afipia sp. 62-7]|nr:MAG: disulfide bond formation protein DsbA [Afipia sp. 62-7]
MILGIRQKYFALLAIALAGAMLALAPARTASAQEQAGANDVLSRDAVLRDAEIPALGNPKGDVTIVEWFDYQCPYCKTLSPELEKIIREDGHVRLVLKDWPILGPPSPDAARLVLATKYQNRFEAAHKALMTHVGRLTAGTIDSTLAAAGIDVARAKSDLEANKAAIDALLKRNNEQAEGLGFNSTPSFIVGTFRIPGVMKPELFKQAIADARKAAKQGGAKKK